MSPKLRPQGERTPTCGHRATRRSPTGRCAHCRDRSFLQLAGDGLRLRDLLRLEALALQHVHEVHVAADVELVRAIDGHAAIFEQLREHAVGDGGADLALWMSSPTIGTLNFSGISAHSGVPAMNTGSALTKATPASIAHCA